ncbi:nitrile hydratase accessory protein [uncultured Roseibium sp.]|uniref:nitrile hydratase accessory protein n=1 Tax=uncultured Roseibium sp. TaxID=1936171 RepID=UPI00260747C8|nr:nitrile hydratase accessory protein [uncultured Roseibium sp.]
MTLPEASIKAALPDLPLDRDGEPVFGAPWEARVFAMTVKAHEAGLFTWKEWTQALGAELAGDGETAPESPGYYDRWLAVFETLLTAKGVAAGGQLAALKVAWDKAAHATPHGQPIELDKGRI